MKILFAVSVFDIGGAEVLALRLAQQLHERGHEIMVFAANEKLFNKQLAAKYSPYIKSVYSLADWPVVRFVASKLNALLRRLGFGDALILKVKSHFLRFVIKSEKVDLICSHSPRSDKVCAEAVKKLSVPFITVEHGIYSHYLHIGKKQLLQPLRAATEIIAVSDFCEKQIRSYVGTSAAITTIYNGVIIDPPHSRLQVRKELGIGDGDIAFGLAARGVPQKGWQAAIDAFLKLKTATRKGVHLILVGGSDYVDTLKETYKIHTDIHFIGKVANPAHYIDAVDVGLMLSMYRTEALSLIAIEFLMLGKPVIATNVGGVPEVIQTGAGSSCQLIDLDKTGAIDTEELTTAMLSFTKGEKSLALGAAPVEAIHKKFSMEACAGAYETFFRRVIARNRKDHTPSAQGGQKASAVKQKVPQAEAVYS